MKATTVTTTGPRIPALVFLKRDDVLTETSMARERSAIAKKRAALTAERAAVAEEGVCLANARAPFAKERDSVVRRSTGYSQRTELDEAAIRASFVKWRDQENASFDDKRAGYETQMKRETASFTEEILGGERQTELDLRTRMLSSPKKWEPK
ncbi:hypothetical protein FN846DRAFT_910535 [Sphaerosporella brunnea]|uniref:Uncharacterized protein n=1 Tax=Sphaerosporella brunnea TaxID=1250544 RepID=A0A5J5EMV1_9PEZI|nr:hypothetical protein FN846DRAFT_910535 [Sphaerosporella brunnea]